MEKIEISKKLNGLYTIKGYNFNNEMTYELKDAIEKEVLTEIESFIFLNQYKKAV